MVALDDDISNGFAAVDFDPLDVHDSCLLDQHRQQPKGELFNFECRREGKSNIMLLCTRLHAGWLNLYVKSLDDRTILLKVWLTRSYASPIV